MCIQSDLLEHKIACSYVFLVIVLALQMYKIAHSEVNISLMHRLVFYSDFKDLFFLSFFCFFLFENELRVLKYTRIIVENVSKNVFNNEYLIGIHKIQ